MSSVQRITRQNTEKIQMFLTAHGVPFGQTQAAPIDLVATAKRILVDAQDSAGDEVLRPAPIYTEAQATGLCIVKPEMLPFYERYLEFLKQHAITVLGVSEPFCPTHEQWMAQYGDVIASYPRVIHSYITQRSIGIRAVRFAHNPQAYTKSTDLMSLDNDYLFDQTFCGAVDIRTDTLRGRVSRDTLIDLGFASMEGYAEPFDIFGYYRSGVSNPLRTYNGVHIPSNYEEKMTNYSSYGAMIP